MRINYLFRLVMALAISALAALLAPAIASAQTITTGAVSGTITDPTDAVIVGAKVTLKSLATNTEQTISSTAEGLYQFSLLKPGDYSITVEKEGFAKISQPVTVLLGQTVAANIKLQTGAISTSIQVEAAPPILQTEDANLTTVYEQKEISEIPNPGNDITYTAQTAPGVLMNNSTLGGYGNFTAFGLPADANLFTIDGNDYNDPFLNLNNSGSSNLLLGNDDIAEVAVVSNGYTGQYGRQAGAQVDYTTKSGTNGLHGDMLYDWTGRLLTANDPLNKLGEEAAGVANTRPFENNNQWAATLGGPIVKNKAFFFVETEGIRYIFGSIATIYTPTSAFEKYVLATVPQDAETQAFYNNVFSLYNGAPGISKAVAQKGSCSSLGGFVPVGSPEGTAATTYCLQSWSNALSNGNTEWELTGRVDYEFNPNDKLFGRFVKDKGVQPTYTDAINPAFNNTSNQPSWQGQLNYTHVFSSTVLNSFVASGFWYSALFGSLQPAKALSLFPGNLEFSADGSDLTPLGTGSGSPNGFASGFLFPQGRDVTQYQFVDDLSIFRGIHSFKMGINFRRNDISDHTASELNQYPVVVTSLLGFATDQVSPTDLCLDESECGTVNENFSLHLAEPIAVYSFGLYFQDEVRVTPKLKLTLALRADRNSGGACQKSCAALPPVSWDSMSHGEAIPYNESFGAGRTSIFPSVESVVFEPRIGVAWTPIGQNTVIRGGIGLFTDLYPGVLLDYFTTNFPQETQWSSNPGTATVAFDNLPLATTAFPSSGPAFVKTCNAAFQTNYADGGSLTTGGPSEGGYEGLAPTCVTPTGAPSVPNYQATGSKVLNPKYLEWNVQVQHTFARNTVFSANYVGNHGYDETMFNPYANAFCDTLCTGAGLTNTGLPGAPPDPRVATVLLLTNNSYSNYNGLTLSLQENGWHGLSGRFGYTYSHSLDIVSNGGINPYAVLTSLYEQINPYNVRAQYASSDYDARHAINGSYLYELPFKSENRLLDAAIGGWQVSGTLFWHTGFPFSVIDGALVSGLGPSENFSDSLGSATILLQPVSTFTQRNFSNGRPCAAALDGLAAPCFTGADFAAETNFTGSVVGRNAFRGPGFLGGDMSVRKMFRMTERVKLQIGLNAFNVFNHANFGHPWGNTIIFPMGTDGFTATEPTSPYGAFAAAATDQRIAQLQARLYF